MSTEERRLLWREVLVREIRRLWLRGEKVRPELLRWAGIEAS